MKSFLFSVLAVFAIALAPSLAWAGGGTKNNSTLRVTNNSSDTAVVAVNNTTLSNSFSSFTGTQLDAGEVASLRSQVEAQGGRVLSGGQSTSFSTRQGSSTVTVLLIDANGNVINTAGTGSISTGRGTTNASITGTAGGTATVTRTN